MAVVPVVFIVFALFVVIALRLAASSRDREKVEGYLANTFAKLERMEWAPFSGSKHERAYDVTYVDAAGNRHQARCKTRTWGDVYWTNDRIVGRATHGAERTGGFPVVGGREPVELDEIERLRIENAMLRRTLRERGG